MVDNFATLTLINYEGTVYRIYIVMGGSCQRNVYEIDYVILVKLLLTYLHNSFTLSASSIVWELCTPS